ncbi:protein-L-isoaspartate(D-aspartate) O-methyltransferase [soil metagenome]
MSLDRLAAPRTARGAEPPAKAKAVAKSGSHDLKAASLVPVRQPPSRSPSSNPPNKADLAPRAPSVGTTLRPQAPLHHAAQHAANRSAAPSGLGLDSALTRQRMVTRLRRVGIRNEAVLDAMGQVPRHQFVDAALAAQAYEDTSLPIGLNQTISKPSVVSRMIELLCGGVNARLAAVTDRPLGRVLEIGTGCGYQAAVLSRMAKSVLSVERLKPLHEKARELLAPIRAASTGAGGANIRLVYGDGMLGHAPNAPYDSIVSAAGGDRLPQAWLDQLAVGGRLVAPLLDVRQGSQVLVVIDRTDAGFERSVHESVHFVPLKSGVD